MNSFNACNLSWWDVLGPTSRTKDNHLFSFGEVDILIFNLLADDQS